MRALAVPNQRVRSAGQARRFMTATTFGVATSSSVIFVGTFLSLSLPKAYATAVSTNQDKNNAPEENGVVAVKKRRGAQRSCRHPKRSVSDPTDWLMCPRASSSAPFLAILDTLQLLM